MLKQLKPAFMMMVVMTILTGFVYPGIITALAQVLFPAQANGSLITANGQVIGAVNSHRYPAFFELNFHAERRVAFRGQWWALRAGFNNIARKSD